MRFFAVAIVLFVAACAAPQKHLGPGPVALGVWCDEAGTAMCNAMADRCFGGSGQVADGCNATSKTSCLAGRDPATPSGRTGDELDQCVALLRSLSCEQLGAQLGTGALADRCAARVQP